MKRPIGAVAALRIVPRCVTEAPPAVRRPTDESEGLSDSPTHSTSPSLRAKGEAPAVATPQALADMRELAVIAVERTRMPMVVTDPRQPDNPIVLANHAFLHMTGYGADEVLGRNCRFLQGPDTSRGTVAELRDAIVEEREITVDLLNYRKDGATFWNRLLVSPIHDDDGRLLYFFASQKDVTREREARDREAAELRLLREVDHRAKNVLALVQGIVRMSRADTVQHYAAAVQGRVQALSRAHGMLAERRWHEVPLDRLIAAEIEPFGSERLSLDGPPVGLPAQLVQPIALLIYELVSNATQHGALSADLGSVAVGWHEDAAADRLVITWREIGGPRPAEKRTRGFGFTIMTAIVERQLRGRIELDWRPDGLAGRFSVPLHRRK